MSETAVVTGAAGFIGSHVVDRLVSRGVRVIAIDNLSGGFRDNIDPRALFIEANVTDRSAMHEVFETYAPALVYHLAAYAAEGLSHFIRHFNYTNNLLGSVNLINEAITHKIRCFVFASSIAVYGRNQLPMSEDLIPQPDDPYGIAKAAVEADLRSANKMFGLDYVIFRPHNVYGERQNVGDPYRNVVGIFMNQILQRRPLTVFGDGSQIRAFSYVGDVAPVMAEAPFVSLAKNQVFNVGADEHCTVLHLAERVAFHMGVAKADVRFLPARDEVFAAYAAHERVKGVFSCEPGLSLDDGLCRMARWVRQHGPRQGRPMKNIEITEGLPGIWVES